MVESAGAVFPINSLNNDLLCFCINEKDQLRYMIFGHYRWVLRDCKTHFTIFKNNNHSANKSFTWLFKALSNIKSQIMHSIERSFQYLNV